MDREEIASKLRGIKSIIIQMSAIKGEIEDREFALILLYEALDDCITELEKKEY